MSVMAIVVLFATIVTEDCRAGSPHEEVCKSTQLLLAGHDYHTAERLLGASLESDPAWEEGHLLLGKTHFNEGHFEQAGLEATKALELRPTLEAFLLCATAAMEAGRLNESIRWLQQASDRYKDQPE